MLALLHQMEQSQWWSPEMIEQHQFRQLSRLVEHAVRTVPWYAERLRDARIVEDGPMTTDRWRRLPILTRAEV